MPDPAPEPTVEPDHIIVVAHGIWVIPDRARTPQVCNIGIVAGDNAVLVVESGIGTENGRVVLECARDIADGRPLLLTTTHFHPEHAYGAHVFRGFATSVVNRAQQVELEEKGPAYLRMFRTFGPHIEAALTGVEFVPSTIVYDGDLDLQLGRRRVELKAGRPAHTRGDQTVFVPDAGVLFTGDLVEERFFPIMPDEDSNGDAWIARLDELAALGASVIVPGHGAAGGPAILSSARESLALAREGATRGVADGLAADQIADAVARDLLERYPDWDNSEWARTVVENFLRLRGQTATPSLDFG